MRNRFGSQEYGVGLPQDGPSGLPDMIDKVTPNGKIKAGGIAQLLKMFQGKMGAYLPADRQEHAPVPRKSAEDNQVAPVECAAVRIDACQRASTSWR